MKAILALSATGEHPKIKPTRSGGAEVTFEIYNVSTDYLLGLVGKVVELTIEEEK